MKGTITNKHHVLGCVTGKNLVCTL